MKKLLFVIMFINSLFLMGQQRIRRPVSWDFYTKPNYTFKFPKNWSLDDSKEYITIMTELDGMGDLFQENVNLLVQPLGSKRVDIGYYLELTKTELRKLNVQNLKTELVYDTNAKMTVGDLTYSMENNGTEIMVKQKIKIRDDSAYIFTYSGNKDGFSKYLSLADIVMNSLVFSNASSSEKSIKPLEYKNLLHKLYFTHLEGYEDINEDNKNYLFHMANFSDDKLRNYSLKFSDDWSFRVVGNDEYAKNVTLETIKSALEIGYSDVSINIFEKSFPKTLREKVFHVVFSGVEIESGERMTVATFQMVKNHKMYTLGCGCKSSYFRSYYNDCLKLLKLLTIH